KLLSFRRTFTLLLLLVVLPSAALSGFGVLAIVNERAAVEKRLEAAWGGKLEALGKRLEAQLKAGGVRQTDSGSPALFSPSGTLLSDATFTVRESAVKAEDPRLQAALAAGLPNPSSLGDTSAPLSISSAHGTLVVALRRVGPDIRGFRLSVRSINELLQELGKGL